MLLGVSGSHEGVTKVESEFSIFLVLPGLGDWLEVGGDVDLVEEKLVSDSLDVGLIGANLGDLVEISPVEHAWINLLAHTNGFLHFTEENSGTTSHNEEISEIKVFPVRVLDDFVDEDGILISEVDAVEESGDVEGSNLGSLEETLHDLSNNHSDVFWLVDFCKLELLDLGFSSKFEEVSKEFSEFLHIAIDILSFRDDFLLVILKVGGNLWKVLHGVREDSHIFLDWGNIEF